MLNKQVHHYANLTNFTQRQISLCLYDYNFKIQIIYIQDIDMNLPLT